MSNKNWTPKYLYGGITKLINATKRLFRSPYEIDIDNTIKAIKLGEKKAHKLLGGNGYTDRVNNAHFFKGYTDNFMPTEEVIRIMGRSPYTKFYHPETGQLIYGTEYLNASPFFKDKIEIGIDPAEFLNKYGNKYKSIYDGFIGR